MTVPVLVQGIIDRQMVSKLLKMQNILSTAYKNNFQVYGSSISDYASKEQVIKAFEDGFIGVSHDCVNDTCLHDGAEISYSDFDSGCSIEAPGGASTLKNSCMAIVTDLNGVKKKPNKPGKDRFRFWVTRDGVYPEGNLGSCSNGYDCTAYVILNQKLFDYEKQNAMGDSIPEGCSDAECTGCNDGYVLNDGVCTPIQQANCVSFSGVECTSCAVGYRLSNGVCIENDPDIKDVNGVQVYYNKDDYNSYENAQTTCEEKNMRLATVDEYQSIYSDCSSIDETSCSGDYWASTGQMIHFNNGVQVENINYNNFGTGFGHIGIPSQHIARVLCVQN